MSFKSQAPKKSRGCVLEHARVPFIGARVKRYAPGHGDNGTQGTIINLILPGEPDPTHEAWHVEILWPGRHKTTEFVTY